MNQLYIFIIRIVLGAVFAVLLARFFYPEAHPAYAVGLGIFLVGTAYLVEYVRKRKPKP